MELHVETHKAVERKVRSLKIRRSPDYDSINPKLLRTGSLGISSTFMYLINMCLTSSVFPSALKKSKVSLIYKGDHL